MPLPTATIRTQVSVRLRVALLSNNPDKARQLRRFGVTVAAQVPTGVHLSATNAGISRRRRTGAHTRSTSRCRQAESPCSASR
jgi:GTP cyclohydrolase II